MTAYCQKLFANRRSTESKIECAECGQWLMLVSPSKGINAKQICDHAAKHLGKLIYTCRRCQHKTPTKGAMQSHMFKAHRLKKRKENYIDSSTNYEKEIFVMVKHCFGPENPGMPER